MDSIRVLGMTFAACHGVHPEEKAAPQRFEVDVEIVRDLSVAAKSDCLDDTVDYSRIVSIVRDVMEGETCNLLERLAGKIIERLAEYVRGANVMVYIRKPGAPLAVPFRTVEIKLERELPA
jgi:dihydroneopterin aldolase